MKDKKGRVLARRGARMLSHEEATNVTGTVARTLTVCSAHFENGKVVPGRRP